ncbi:MAG: PEP-CTERM sorting domain-containing protein [Pseudomonadota bacterium]
MSLPLSRLSIASRAAGVALCLAAAGAAQAANLTFASTSDAAAWQVAVAHPGVDGQLSSFPSSGFAPALSINGRQTEGIGWIANNSSGTNGWGIGDWTFFVFRQTFDLTGYDPATAVLRFQWAADDSGQGFADRGTWTPKYRLNGGPLVPGAWLGDYSYDFGPEVVISSGFRAGLNTIDFYVEGNGVTDGFALKPLGLTAAPVPEPAAMALMLGGLAVVGWAARRR